MRLSLFRHPGGVRTTGGSRVVYDLENGVAAFGAAAVAGPALMWELEAGDEEPPGALLSRTVELDRAIEWVARCDRVDFPLGGIAHLHVHPGPGIRYLLAGELTIESEGRTTTYEQGGAWFESGPEPVLARASLELETSFVRVLVLPAEWAGKRTIRYLEPPPEQEGAPTQSATVYLEQPLTLPP